MSEESQPYQQKQSQSLEPSSFAQTMQATESQPAVDNNSGSGGVLPDSIKGWNWGAFFLTWIWGIANNTWIALLALISPLTLIMAIILGIKGNEWAWQNRRFDSVEHFKQVQKSWSIAGVIVFSLCLVIMIAIVFLMALKVADFSKEWKELNLENAVPSQASPSALNDVAVPDSL